jgi:exodeoxyribonuclease VIII
VNAPRELRLGLVRDMPAEEYHATRAMSAGGLKRMRQSPAHFYGQVLSPNKPPEKDSKAKANGTLTHCLLLEPHEFDARFTVVPDDAPSRPSIRQRKAAKPSDGTVAAIAWWDAFDAANAGKIIVEPDALAAAKAQAAAVRAVPDLAALLAEGYGEASCFWIDEETGELCKCRPDWTNPAGDGVILVDGKTCRDASPEGFGRAVWNMGYHLQAAWYADGFEKATGQHVHGFVFAAVESDWPHVAMPYMLGDDVLAAARRENRRLLNRYAECKRTGIWPGYGSAVQLINLPKWANLESDE